MPWCATPYAWTRKHRKKCRSVPRRIEVEPEIRFAGTKIRLTCVQVVQRGPNVTRTGGPKLPEPHFTEEIRRSRMAHLWQMEREKSARRISGTRYMNLRRESMYYSVMFGRENVLPMQHGKHFSHKKCTLALEGCKTHLHFSPLSSENAFFMWNLLPTLHGKHISEVRLYETNTTILIIARETRNSGQEKRK